MRPALHRARGRDPVIRGVVSHALGALLVELLAPPIREWAERRRLKKRRRSFRQECAGPDADYCELHGECWRCCANAAGTCPWHGVQWHAAPETSSEPLTWEGGLAMEALAGFLQRVARGDFDCQCGHPMSEHHENGDILICTAGACNAGYPDGWCYLQLRPELKRLRPTPKAETA